MKISRLLELHRQSKPDHTLEQNFGDGFLMQNNSIYRSVREGAARLGYRYVNETSSSYLTLPLSQLNILLDEKKIPYVDNVSVLSEIEKKIPQTTDWDEIRDNLKRNYVFHESCHAISNHESKVIFGKMESTEISVTRLLLEESFSNTCELLAIVDAEQSAHRIFFEANSYIFMFEDRVLLKDLILRFGRGFIFKLMMLCYLQSNFLNDRLEEKSFDHLLKLLPDIKADAKDLKKLRAIAKIAFDLNPRFREVTTGFYLRLCGFKSDRNELKKINFMGLIKNDQRFFNLIDRLAETVM